METRYNEKKYGESSNSTAHAGTATATVYAIQSDADFGNPVSVEVNIVAACGGIGAVLGTIALI